MSCSLVNLKCLEAGLKSNNNKTVEILIRNKNWKNLFTDSDPKKLEQIYADLIDTMPDNMELVLDKLYDVENQKYDFKLIDLPIYNTIKNHPLYHISKSNDERLLAHNSVKILIELKSKYFPRLAFFWDLFLYVLYAVFLSFYHLVYQIQVNQFSENETDGNSSNSNSSFENISNKKIFFLKDINFIINIYLFNFVFYLIIFLITILLSKEMYQMITNGLFDYFSSVDNWFQLTTLICAIISIFPLVDSSVQIASGSFSVLFAWVSTSLFFQNLQIFGLGRYIVAFRKTIQNSFKFMPFFLIICVGFFFAYKIGDKLEYRQNILPNEYDPKSSNFLGIITMMIGDLRIPDFDSSNPQNHFEDLFKFKNIYKSVMFLFFVFLMCIIILSLFEGIAVGEIKIVLDKAQFQIIEASILNALYIQMVCYYMYRLINKNTNKEPTFMTFGEFNYKTNEKTGKKYVEAIKKIDKNCQLLLIRLNNLTSQLNEQVTQVGVIRKNVIKF